MTAPLVEAISSHSSVAGETAATITLPNPIARGDLILLYLGSGSTGTTPLVKIAEGQLDDYCLLFERDTGSANQSAVTALCKRANGDEGGTTVTADPVSPSVGRANFAVVISGADGLTMPDLTAITVATSTNPDPPNNNAIWGSADNLWIAHCTTGGTTQTTGDPTGYSASTRISGTASNGCNSSIAHKQATAGSDNPSNWTRASAHWTASTCVVRPAQPASAGVDHFTAVSGTTATTYNGSITIESASKRNIVAVSGNMTTPVVTLDPSGLNVVLTPTTDGVTAADGSIVRFYNVPAGVAPGTYTLRFQKASGVRPWRVFCFELTSAELTGAAEVLKFTAQASGYAPTVQGVAGGLIMVAVESSAAGGVSAYTVLINGVPAMGYGQIAQGGSSTATNLLVGRAIAGTNTVTISNSFASTQDGVIVSLGYAAPSGALMAGAL